MGADRTRGRLGRVGVVVAEGPERRTTPATGGLERLAAVEQANLALWAETKPDNDARLEPMCVALAQLAGETFPPPPDATIGAKWTETLQALHKGAQACADAIHGVVKDDGTMARELIKGRNQLAELITALR